MGENKFKLKIITIKLPFLQRIPIKKKQGK